MRGRAGKIWMKIKRWLPRFELLIDLYPIFRVRTAIMREMYGRLEFEYVHVTVEIFKRRVFYFNVMRRERI